MDNATDDIFGQRKLTQAEEGWHNNQKRKQYDIIRVKNPTSEDFFVMYDVNQFQKVAANSTLDVPRYIALRYVQHMKDKIINDKANEELRELKKKFEEKGTPNSTWAAHSQQEGQTKYKTDNPQMMAEVMDVLWVGLVHEFGRDIPPTNQTVDPRSGEVDLRPAEMRVLESFQNRKVNGPTTEPVTPTPAPIPQSPTATIPPEKSPFAALNESLTAEEITNNE